MNDGINVLTYITCNYCGTNFQVAVPKTTDYAIPKPTRKKKYSNYDETFKTKCPQCGKNLIICIILKQE